MPLISVIVPVYKVEPYLSRCIDSILAQTFTDFELILIDDGSPDNCGKLCDDYAEKDSRVFVIHQENRGVSAARNAGINWALNNSDSKFFAFIDSDDAVTDNYLEKLISGVANPSVDIVSCKMQFITEQGEKLAPDQYVNNPPEQFNGRDAVYHLYKMDGKLSIEIWGKLYRKNLFANIRLPEGKIHEDQAMVPIILYSAKNVVVFFDELYIYYVRNESIMHQKFSVARFDDITALQSCEDFFVKKEEHEIVSLINNRKLVIQALYTLTARKEGIYKDIPKQYKISKFKALHTLEKRMSTEQFSWRLSQVCPKLVKPYSIWASILKKFNLYK